MDKTDVAAAFAEMADILEILSGDKFRINSYRKCARVLGDLAEDINVLAREERLTDIPGVGDSSAQKITELLSTGKMARLEELRGQIPPGLTELIKVQNLGPKTAAKLWREAGVTSPADLREAIAHEPAKLLAIEGMGEKKLAQLQEALAFAATAAGRVRIDEAQRVADILLTVVRAAKAPGIKPGKLRLEVAGSLRRRCETIGDVDIVCEAAPEQAGAIIDAFASADGVVKVLAKGTTKSSVMLGHVQADLRVVGAESYGAALQYFTGSKAHNVALRELAVKRGWRLNEYGLYDEQGKAIAGADEEGIYRALGLAYVEPELREDRGEIAAATEGKLPKLVCLGDIRGDLHMHTRASDGEGTIAEMIDSCRQRGYAYMAITDHSHSERQANGLDEKRLAEHVAAIHQAAAASKDILVLAGSEVDILKDGELDYPKGVLAELDFVLAAPHSFLASKGDEPTARIIRAIENGRVHAVAHPTGRLINRRGGMEIDIVKVARAAAANDVALEINADPMRLDLRDVYARSAIEAGAKIIINTDTHNVGPHGSLANMAYGVATARRGWATAADVVNTWPVGRFRGWLAKKKR
jgi:DNA polymerase (family 10)